MRSLRFHLKELVPHRPGCAVGREDDLFDDFEMTVKSSVSCIYYKIVGALYIVFCFVDHLAENISCSLLSDHCCCSSATDCSELASKVIVS